MNKEKAEIGDIIVRTGRYPGSRAKIGTMAKVNYINHSTNTVQYGSYIEILHDHYRLANDDEIKYYTMGYRNVSYVKYKTVDHFSII